MMDRLQTAFDDDLFDAAGDLGFPAPNWPRFEPPSIDPANLALTNQLSLRRPPVTITMGDAAITFTPIGLGPLDIAAEPSERETLWFTIDGRPAVSMSSFSRVSIRSFWRQISIARSCRYCWSPAARTTSPLLRPG